MIAEDANADRCALLVSIFATAFVFFGRFGYDVGTGDQDEFMPLLIHLLDATVLGGDWFVNTQLESFSIRLPLVIVLEPLASLFSPSSAVFIVYICAFVLAVTATHLLARMLFQSNLVAVIATVTGLGITKLWTLGGNDVLTTMLVPSMVAWACALWALLAATRKQFGLSGVWCGIAILFQPLVGIHMTLLCSVIVLTELVGERANLDLGRTTWTAVCKVLWSAVKIPVIALVVGTPVLLPVFLAQIKNPLSVESLFIYTLFRAPHHFIPAAFNQIMMWRFFALALTGIAALFWIVRSGNAEVKTASDQTASNHAASDQTATNHAASDPHEPRRTHRTSERTSRILFTALSIISLLLITAYLNASYLHIATLTQLQLFKISVIGKLLLVMVISEVIFSWLVAERFTEKLSSWLTRPLVWRSTAAAVLLLLTGAWTYAPLTARNLPAVSRASSPEAELYAWIREHTSPEAIFAVPPDHSGFTYYAKRARYVNFKAFPYHEKDIQEWYRRILTQTPLSGASFSESGITLPDSRGMSGLKKSVESYESANNFILYEFASKEEVQYILRRTPIDPPETPDLIHVVFQNRQWHLYRVERATS